MLQLNFFFICLWVVCIYSLTNSCLHTGQLSQLRSFAIMRVTHTEPLVMWQIFSPVCHCPSTLLMIEMTFLPEGHRTANVFHPKTLVVGIFPFTS